MAIELTKEQELCVTSEGNILVAAAAGSGKTAVLVERVINRLASTTNPISADKLLIVTFTNAAAAEMRGRIEKRLEEECRKNPNNIGLIKQKHLLGSAKICTIDSFCIDLVRENFEKAGVSPDFKMSDGNSLRPYDEKILSNIINRYLEEENETFVRLLDIIGAEYDDFGFLEFVLNIFNYSRQMPFPERWFDSLSDFYKDKEFTKNSPWWRYAFDTAKTIIEDSKNSLAVAIDLITVHEKAYEKFFPAFSIAAKEINNLDSILDTEDWDSFFNAINAFVLPSLPRVNGLTGINEITAAKSIYKYISEKVTEKLGKLFYENIDFINSQFELLYEPLKLLSKILKELEKDIFEKYLEINSFTFHNTEQLALGLLCEEKDGEIVIKEDAYEFLNRFDEVMVDEYQDTNDLQDLLFYILSNKEKKLFAVGDVKQSIYGFRGANPKNFLNKKRRYIPIADAKDNDAKKIILSKNFRSKNKVCNFINFFFENFMTNDTGDIIYDSEEALVAGAKYPENNDKTVELDLINLKSSDIDSLTAQARSIAVKIKEIMSSGDVIRLDNDNLRPARFSDFTILLRSVRYKAPILANELRKQGIPVDFANEGYAETYEISTFLSLLKIIDNPHSDIELLSVMMSPLFSFTPEEMAKIRTVKKDGDIYSAVIFSSDKNEKVKLFLKTLERYRLAAVTTPLSGLINYLLNDTGYLDIMSALSEGEKRRGNLLLLSSYAAQYSSNNTDGLGGFVRYILKQSESGLKSADSGSLGDSVKIMSIHASKGLQFPVCIISGIESSFNDSESIDSCLYSTDFGIGFRYFDEELKTKVTTIGREIILDKIRRERLEEELRLFYVAMTRAQDKLIFTGAVSNLEKKIDDIKILLISSDSKINSSIWNRTKSYLDWLTLSTLLHPMGKELRQNGSSVLVKDTKSEIYVNLIEAEDLPDNSDISEETTTPDIGIADKIKENLAFRYPYEEIINIESKTSVSALANKAESIKYAFCGEPSFMSKGGITATGRGTAMHKVMQFIDFAKCNDIESEIERLYEWQFISEIEAESLNIEKLKEFFQSAVFNRIQNANTVKREMRFLTEIPAKNISPDLDLRFENEKVIVQGAVDVCFIEDDGIVVLDFKTDRVDNTEQLIESYGEQLSIYAAACEKIFEKPVKDKIIYSFALSKEIRI